MDRNTTAENKVFPIIKMYEGLEGIYQTFIANLENAIKANKSLDKNVERDGHDLSFDFLGQRLKISFSTAYDAPDKLKGKIALVKIENDKEKENKILSDDYFDLGGRTTKSGIGLSNPESLLLQWLSECLTNRDFQVE